MTQLRSVTCHVGSHSVTCYPTQMNAPRLHPSQTGWYLIWRLNKPRSRVQRATGPRLLRDHLQPARLEPTTASRARSPLGYRFTVPVSGACVMGISSAVGIWYVKLVSRTSATFCHPCIAPLRVILPLCWPKMGELSFVGFFHAGNCFHPDFFS